MANDTDTYTPQSARLAGEYLFVGLLVFAVVIFTSMPLRISYQ
jgi:hypothetical protein